MRQRILVLILLIALTAGVSYLLLPNLSRTLTPPTPMAQNQPVALPDLASFRWLGGTNGYLLLQTSLFSGAAVIHIVSWTQDNPSTGTVQKVCTTPIQNPNNYYGPSRSVWLCFPGNEPSVLLQNGLELYCWSKSGDHFRCSRRVEGHAVVALSKYGKHILTQDYQGRYGFYVTPSLEEIGSNGEWRNLIPQARGATQLFVTDDERCVLQISLEGNGDRLTIRRVEVDTGTLREVGTLPCPFNTSVIDCDQISGKVILTTISTTAVAPDYQTRWHCTVLDESGSKVADTLLKQEPKIRWQHLWDPEARQFILPRYGIYSRETPLSPSKPSLTVDIVDQKGTDIRELKFVYPPVP